MYLSFNFDFFSNFSNLYSNPFSKTTYTILIGIYFKSFSFYFKLSYSKFARDLQNTQIQTQNPPCDNY